MIAARKIHRDTKQAIEKKLSSIFHLSHPILRKYKGEIFISMFVLLDDDEANGKRLSAYCLTDLATGTVRHYTDCNEKTFRNKIPVLFEKERLHTLDTEEESLDSIYSRLDGARQTLLETGETARFANDYRKYFSRLMTIVPEDLRPVYKLFSNVLEEEGRTERLASSVAPSPAEKEEKSSGTVPAPASPIDSHPKKINAEQKPAAVAEKGDRLAEGDKTGTDALPASSRPSGEDLPPAAIKPPIPEEKSREEKAAGTDTNSAPYSASTCVGTSQAEPGTPAAGADNHKQEEHDPGTENILVPVNPDQEGQSPAREEEKENRKKKEEREKRIDAPAHQENRELIQETQERKTEDNTSVQKAEAVKDQTGEEPARKEKASSWPTKNEETKISAAGKTDVAAEPEEALTDKETGATDKEENHMPSVPESKETAGDGAADKHQTIAPVNPVLRDIRWHPRMNLSVLPEKYFRIMERVAEHIRFLACDVPGILRYEFPLYCFKKDGHGCPDAWMELLAMIRNEEMSKGHFRIRPRDTIYSTCPKGKEKGCIFGKCPYVVAAYIRFLKETNPEELKREREEYRKNRFEVDARFSEPPACEIALPSRMEADNVRRGLAFSDTGTVNVLTLDKENIGVFWLEDLGPKGYQIEERVLPASVLGTKAESPDEWRDRNGRPLPKMIAYAILANYLDRKGIYRETVRALKKQEGVETAKPEQNPKQRHPHDHQEYPEQKPMDLEEFADPTSTAFRTLRSSEVKTFYGAILTEKPARESGALKALTQELKNKGFKGIRILSPEKLEEEERKEGWVYAVTGMNGFLKNQIALEKGQLSTEEGEKHLRSIKALRTFLPESAVVLCLSGEAFKLLSSHDPDIKQIYGECMLIEPSRTADEIYEALMAKLPENLRAMADKKTRTEFNDWYRKNRHSLPTTEDTLADHLAWRCSVKGAFVFEQNREDGSRTEQRKGENHED